MADEEPTLEELLTNAVIAREKLERGKSNLAAAESLYVQAARNHSMTWTEIGEKLGMSQQLVWEKYHTSAEVQGAVRRANMDDVAALAGVNRRTVYRVISEPHLVADDTRQAVVRAMASLGYEHPDDRRTQDTKTKTG